MLKHFGLFLLYAIVLTVVLSVELSYGLPVLFLGLVIICTTLQSTWFRQAWLIISGILLAAMLHFSLAGGVLLVSVLFGFWYGASFFLKNTSVRILVCAVLGVLLLLIFVPYAVTATVWLSSLVSATILGLLTRFFILVPDITHQNGYIDRLPRK